MPGNEKGQHRNTHIFRDGEHIGDQKISNWTTQANIDSERKNYQGEKDSEVDVDHNGWRCSGTIHKVNHGLSDAVNTQIEDYKDPTKKVDTFEIVVKDTIPAKGGATKVHRYLEAKLTEYEESDDGKGEDVEVNVTWEAKKRVEVT